MKLRELVEIAEKAGLSMETEIVLRALGTDKPALTSNVWAEPKQVLNRTLDRTETKLHIYVD